MSATKVPTPKETKQALETVNRAAHAHAQTKKETHRRNQIMQRIAKDNQTAKEYNELAKALFDELYKTLPDDRSKDLLFNLFLVKEGAMYLSLYPSGLTATHRKTYAWASGKAKKLLRGKK